MNTKKMIFATVAAFIVMFLLGYLWHAVLMVDFYASNPGEIGNAGRETPKIPFIILGYLFLALVMAYIYPKGAEGSNHVMDGLKFGAIVGFLWIVPHSTALYGATTLFSKTGIFGDGIYHIVEGAIGGIIIAMIYRKQSTTEATEKTEAPEITEAPQSTETTGEAETSE